MRAEEINGVCVSIKACSDKNIKVRANMKAVGDVVAIGELLATFFLKCVSRACLLQCLCAVWAGRNIIRLR